MPNVVETRYVRELMNTLKSMTKDKEKIEELFAEVLRNEVYMFPAEQIVPKAVKEVVPYVHPTI